MNNRHLQLPANCAILNEEEMTYTTGGGVISSVLYAVGRMFRSTRYSYGENQGGSTTGSWGTVVSRPGRVDTASGSSSQYGGSTFSISANIGDFFYGLGQLFAAFGL